MFEEELSALTKTLQESLEELGYPIPKEINWSPTPFSGQWGFGTAVCFQVAALVAKTETGLSVPKKAAEIALELAGQMQTPAGFERISAEQAYINAYFHTPVYTHKVIEAILSREEDFGRGEPKGERVMVEYAQPNTHHSIHIGHARNFILGESLARIVEFAGFDTIRASYPGDLGLTVITCLWAYEKFHEGEEPQGVFERGRWLAEIYTKANTLLTPKEDETEEERRLRESYDEERREMYQEWDAGDHEVHGLWLKTRQWSLDELKAILELLNIHIDVYFFESEVDEEAKAIVEELIELGIAEDERPEGPVIVKIDEQLGLEKEQFRTVVILRSDGTTLYSTKDLALAKRKFEEYQVDRSIYVVDVRQSLHFQQVFQILKLWGFPQAEKCHHLPYGFVSLPEGAMSSRRGNVVYLTDVVEEAERRVREIIQEKNPDLDPKLRGTVARQIGLGALAYSMLSVDNNKDIVFHWEEALNFEGESAPYIQNAHVRANSILRKAEKFPTEANYDYDLDPMEIELIEALSKFPTVAEKAAMEYKPLHLSNYVYQLAQTFHSFYQRVPVLKSETAAMRNARLRIVAAVKWVLAKGLWLLDIEAPEVM